ncbi:hypothetical protein HanHA300_Chr05g0171751 [Helianthus annuus]|nr:hypothetical protein HanHA300_Chr05g0171751 [Helianthus annuus]KAJ0584218.1 hypothetical protein HanHA89_Chr05g0186011 [Helianthus annuus]KAJ0749887.1 hypothetical protein HanLR1_Chr05g0175411 [Helianthus annuus]
MVVRCGSGSVFGLMLAQLGLTRSNRVNSVDSWVRVSRHGSGVKRFGLTRSNQVSFSTRKLAMRFIYLRCYIVFIYFVTNELEPT